MLVGCYSLKPHLSAIYHINPFLFCTLSQPTSKWFKNCTNTSLLSSSSTCPYCDSVLMVNRTFPSCFKSNSIRTQSF
ncbi:hypothetical protein BC01_006 [Bacillus phage BC01]|nr:hypothetical protein BC01_006 [Bacillus phage BC01]